jgi:cation transporter-like permease
LDTRPLAHRPLGGAVNIFLRASLIQAIFRMHLAPIISSSFILHSKLADFHVFVVVVVVFYSHRYGSCPDMMDKRHIQVT